MSEPLTDTVIVITAELVWETKDFCENVDDNKPVKGKCEKESERYE